MGNLNRSNFRHELIAEGAIAAGAANPNVATQTTWTIAGEYSAEVEARANPNAHELLLPNNADAFADPHKGIIGGLIVVAVAGIAIQSVSALPWAIAPTGNTDYAIDVGLDAPAILRRTLANGGITTTIVTPTAGTRAEDLSILLYAHKLPSYAPLY